MFFAKTASLCFLCKPAGMFERHLLQRHLVHTQGTKRGNMFTCDPPRDRVLFTAIMWMVHKENELLHIRRRWMATRVAKARWGHNESNSRLRRTFKDVVAVDIDAKFGPLERVLGLADGLLDGLLHGLLDGAPQWASRMGLWASGGEKTRTRRH